MSSLAFFQVDYTLWYCDNCLHIVPILQDLLTIYSYSIADELADEKVLNSAILTREIYK